MFPDSVAELEVLVEHVAEGEGDGLERSVSTLDLSAVWGRRGKYFQNYV